jgi:hypothetical protein
VAVWDIGVAARDIFIRSLPASAVSLLVNRSKEVHFCEEFFEPTSDRKPRE